MASRWLWNATPLWVSEQEVGREIKRAELNALDATTSVFHFFGAASERRTLTCLIIGESAKNVLIADAIANTTRTVTTPFGSFSAKLDKDVKFTSKQYASLFLDGVAYLGDATALYEASLEIIAV